VASRLKEFVVPVTGDATGFAKAMRDAASVASAESRRIERSLSGVNRLLGGLGVGISVAGFASAIKGAIDYGDKLRDLAKAANSTVEQVGALDFLAAKTGASVDEAARAVGRLQKNLGDVEGGGGKKAAAALDALGLSAEQLARSPVTEQLARIAGQLAQVESPAQRAAIGAALFGGSFRRLAPLLAEGEEGIRKITERFGELGGAITGENADKFDEFNDTIVDLQFAARNAFVELASGLAPTLTQFLVDVANLVPNARSGLTDFFTEIEEGVKRASGSLDSLDGKVAGGLAKIFKGTAFGDAKQRQADESNRRAGLLKQEADTLADFTKPQAEAPTFGRTTPQRTGVKDFNLQTGKSEAEKESDKRIKAAQREREKITRELKQESDDVRNYLQDVSRSREEAFAQSQTAIRREAAAAFDATRTPLEKYQIEVRRLLALGLDDETLQRAVSKAAAEMDEATAKTKETTKAANELGLTFTSAFEDAILEGEKLGGVLDSLAKDIARVLLRKTVTKPVTNLISGLVSGGTGGGGAGGFMSFLSGLFGNSKGGLYKVAGSGGGERPIAFTARAGEVVAVGTGMAQSAGGGAVVINNIGGPPIKGSRQRNVNGRREIDLMFTEAAGSATASGMLAPLGLSPPLVPR
jgi:hypothetical protein